MDHIMLNSAIFCTLALWSAFNQDRPSALFLTAFFCALIIVSGSEHPDPLAELLTFAFGFFKLTLKWSYLILILCHEMLFLTLQFQGLMIEAMYVALCLFVEMLNPGKEFVDTQSPKNFSDVLVYL